MPIHSDPFIIRPAADLLDRQPALRHQANALARKYAWRELVTDEDLQAMGRNLWQALDLDEAFDQARATIGRDILRIIIESDQPAIQRLPWETLYHPTEGFLGQATGYTLARRLPDSPTTSTPVETGPLRVLLFTSLPDDLNPETGRLEVEEEQAQVLEALLPWIAQGVVKLEMPDDGRLSSLEQFLRDFKPHLLFMSGHGQFHEAPHLEAAYGSFLFEGEAGDRQTVRDRDLAERFIGSSVEAVVLSACESGQAASDALNAGLTHHLSRLGIPQVIGMRESILDRAGILFARELIDSLARREALDVALQRARRAITKPLAGATWRDQAGDILSELSLGQWCLPLLLTTNISRPLIDWTSFTPQPPTKRLTNQSLNSISLPERFIGRRTELRQLKSRFRQGNLRHLLITGPGGQGKTALAGKLAQDWQRQGYQVLAWSARPENEWRKFQVELLRQLSPANRQDYTTMAPLLETEEEKANHLLDLMLRQYENRVILFFDNLESLQQPDSLALDDDRLTAWLKAAQSLADQGLILLLTSRWQLPGWPKADHWPLAHLSYGDFLQLARQHTLPADFLTDRDRLRRLYDTLHGNGRGLDYFVAAIENMNQVEEDAFLEKLAQVTTDLQTNMALSQIVAHLSEAQQTLLYRLPAYHTPVPIQGLIKLGLDLPHPEALLDRLLAVSLLEQQWAAKWHCWQYHCPAPVTDWLKENPPHPTSPPGERSHLPTYEGGTEGGWNWPTLLTKAAAYQRWLHDNERYTVSQAIITHQALHRANDTAAAHRFALDEIVGPLNNAGLYRTLLTDWLPAICQAEDEATRGEALGQTGKQYLHVGDYETALQYLQQSLAIRQKIGDRAGIGQCLNNISQIFKARGDYETALQYLKQSLAIWQKIGDRAGEGTTLNNISQIFKARGDYETALQYLQQSLAIQQEIGDRAGIGQCLNNISQIYDARGDYETALQYLQQSLAIWQKIGDRAGEGTTLNNISQIYDARGDYETALQYLQQSLVIQQEIGDRAGLGATLNNMATTAYAGGDYETALQYLQQSLVIWQKIGDVAGLCATLFNMGHIHLQNDQQAEAVQAWVTVYQLASRMQLAQVLAALEGLAEQLGLPGGLAGWAALAERM